MRWGLRIFWMCRVSNMFLHVFTLFPAQQQASQPCFDTDITSSSYRPPCRRQAAGQPVGDVGKVTHGSCAGPSQGRLQNLTGFWNKYSVLFFAALGCLFLHVYMWSNDPCIPKVDTKYSGSKRPGQRVEAILDDRRLRTLCCASGTNFVQPWRGPHCPKRQSLPVETSQPERKMFWKGGLYTRSSSKNKCRHLGATHQFYEGQALQIQFFGHHWHIFRFFRCRMGDSALLRISVSNPVWRFHDMVCWVKIPPANSLNCLCQSN